MSRHTSDYDNLSDHVANALESLSHSSTSEKLAALVSEVESSLALLKNECKQKRDAALDPLTRSSDGIVANAELFEATFKVERLQLAHEKLQSKLEIAVQFEKDQAERALHKVLEEEQNSLAAEFGERYPILAAELADLLGRVKEFEQKKGKSHGLDVESKARNLPSNNLVRGVTLVGRIVDTCRLPAFSVDDAVVGKDFWPLPQRQLTGAEIGGFGSAAQAHAAALGDEIRRIGAEVERNRGRERRANMPSPLHAAPFVPMLDPDTIAKKTA